MFPIIILAAVFLLIAVRQVGRFRFEIWQVMCAGAAAALLTGGIKPAAALRAIDADVMLFLFGMFAAGQVLELSGWLAHAKYEVFKRARTEEGLLLLLVFFMGAASALLMNDTLAIIGTPVALLLARKHGIPPKALLLALAFSITVGSALSPIGNPQNLLVAVKGEVAAPFLTFFKYLALPTLLNLAAVFFLVRFFYRQEFRKVALTHSQEPVRDAALARLAKATAAVLGVMIAAKIILVSLNPAWDFRLTWIALAAAAPGLALSPRRFEILRRTDWSTLAFFAGMFVLMRAVWDTGFFQGLLARSGADIAGLGTVMAVSVVLSQLISNVPLVALYLPMLRHAGAGTPELMALAAASTIAGNMFILGAASNVIIIQAAEKKAGATITFMEFARLGIPLTFINAIIYWVFLKFA
ncbi:MAG: anion transporter [Elusimicrobia bacterium GWA2_61_42]|nr:MAG: anion transporter [Elusimicrobia bacterium GWA2_61_42]OGR75346.1 MAG: anion transporter [Elusimicrobia bacterium GWC2_61_25]